MAINIYWFHAKGNGNQLKKVIADHLSQMQSL